MMGHLSLLEKTASIIPPKMNRSALQQEMPLILWPTNTPKKEKIQIIWVATGQN